MSEDKTGKHIPGTQLSRQRGKKLLEAVAGAASINELSFLRRAIRHELATCRVSMTQLLVHELEKTLHQRVLFLMLRAGDGPTMVRIFNYTINWHFPEQLRQRIRRAFDDRIVDMPVPEVQKLDRGGDYAWEGETRGQAASLRPLSSAERVARYCAGSAVLARPDAQRLPGPWEPEDDEDEDSELMCAPALVDLPIKQIEPRPHFLGTPRPKPKMAVLASMMLLAGIASFNQRGCM